MILNNVAFTFISIFILCVRHAVSKEVYWETSLGPLIGYTKTSLSGYEFIAFEGIPYAKPPIGELRFKAPVPAGGWHGILNATQISPHCFQKIQQYFPSDPESEDCLYLNIYLRNPSKVSQSDVLVGIYGGSFQFGTTRLIGPDILMDHENLIFISFNYRTNIFGHLSLHDPDLEVPGNAGPKDAVLLLHWIQQYIREFGGDPAKVTLIGCSSGGILVNLLALHPVASKLFRHAIAQSGPVLYDLYRHNKFYDILAYHTNYTGSIKNEREFLNHLRKIPANDLIVMYRKYSISTVKRDLQNWIAVVVESKTNNPTPFLTESPDELIFQGKFARMPYLVSFAQFEGGIYNDLAKKMTEKGNYTNYSNGLVAYLRKYLSNDEMKEFNMDIKTFYYGKEIPSHKNKDILLNIIGDEVYLYQNILNWKLMAAASNYQTPIYMYEFNLRTDLNGVSTFQRIPPPYCSHCDELSYCFYTDGIYGLDIRLRINKPLVKWGIEKYTTLILNFVRTGNPNSFDPNEEMSKIQWKPIQSNDLNYLIFQPNFTLARNPFHDRMAFWHRMYHKYFAHKHIPLKIFSSLDMFH